VRVKRITFGNILHLVLFIRESWIMVSVCNWLFF